jgi:hypothetical protein
MPPSNRNLRLGVGAIVSFQSRFLHPHELRDEHFTEREANHRLEDATVVRREPKLIHFKDTMCVVVHHEDFKTEDGKYHMLWCVESHVEVDKEGVKEGFFDIFGETQLRLGVGAKVAFDSKYAHPHKTLDGFLGPGHSMKLENAVVLRREMKPVGHGESSMCVVAEHEKFKDNAGKFCEIYCAESRIEVLQESDPDQCFEACDRKDAAPKASAEIGATDDDAKDESLAHDSKAKGCLHIGFHLTADPFKWEVLGRAFVQLLLAYILTVADLPKAVPTSGPFLIGIVVSTIAVALPHAMYSLTAVFPSLIAVVIL